MSLGGRLLVIGQQADNAVFQAMAKFHRETGCGDEHGHWAECSAAVHAMGYRDWDAWCEVQIFAASLDALNREKTSRPPRGV